MIIGIDLGTTNSLVAYFTDDGPVIIPNRYGKNLTPSVVSIDEANQIYVGELAKERILLYPNSGASVFKRSMGSEKKYKLLEKEFNSEELSSFVLRVLKEDAEIYLGEKVTEAVISVPAYFNDVRRRATKRAGEMAGLKVERIISEPTAAAIAYGLYQNKQNSKFLVFDLGGGTFDVSILELFDSIIEVRAVAGDNFLGGEDFTQVLEDMFYKKFDSINKLELNDRERNHIRNQADLCKISFSHEKTSKMICNIQDQKYEMEVSLSDYEKNCQDLLKKIREPIQKSLSDAHIRISEIDKVVMIGGATKLPIVRNFVSKLFRVIVDTSINPDEAVALGAAIQGALKERNENIKEVILTDVCPFTLGTDVVRQVGQDSYESGYFCPIIERNTVIPTSRTERFYTIKDNQAYINFSILQGESRLAKNNLLLGELNIAIPKNKAGLESVDVTYTYDVNSILEVEIKVVSTGEVTKQILKGQDVDMTDEEIQQRLESLSYLKIHPRDREENQYLLTLGERIYEESLGEKRVYIEQALYKFEQALNTYDNGVIEDAKREFKEFIEEFQSE